MGRRRSAASSLVSLVALFVAIACALALPSVALAQPQDPPRPPGQPFPGPHPRNHRPRFVEPTASANPNARATPPPPPAQPLPSAKPPADTISHDENTAEKSADDEHGPAPFNFADFSNKETPPYLVLVLNAGILFAIYYFMGRKPVANGLKLRKASVAREIEEANRMLKEAEARAKIYQAKLANLEQDLETTKKALEEAGKGERDRIVREANEKAERMQRDAQFLIEQEMKQLRQDLTREAVDIAIAAAETMLKEKVTDADHQRIADDLIAGLATSAKAGAAGAGTVSS